MVQQGINRPGAMERAIDGLTTKVLNERLKKLVNYGILQRYGYPEIPSRRVQTNCISVKSLCISSTKSRNSTKKSSTV